jgi:hypothetical protein
MVCLGCCPVTPIRDVSARLGVSRREVQRLITEDVLVRLSRFLVVGSCLAEQARSDLDVAHQLRVDALLLTYPDAVASHMSGALVLDLPTFDLPVYAVGTREAGAWRSWPDGRLRIAPLPPEHVACVGGRPVTTAPRTVVDLARTASMRAAVVVGDAALARGVPPTAIWTTFDECAEWFDPGPSRRVLNFLDARSESPLESVSRVIFHEHGVPAPEIQHEVVVADRTFRLDFWWKKFRLAGEADGRSKYRSDDPAEIERAHWEEKQREDLLRDDDIRIVRWTYAQMLGQTDATLARIMRRLR